jgi:hypothetical protein
MIGMGLPDGCGYAHQRENGDLLMQKANMMHVFLAVLCNHVLFHLHGTIWIVLRHGNI